MMAAAPRLHVRDDRETLLSMRRVRRKTPVIFPTTQVIILALRSDMAHPASAMENSVFGTMDRSWSFSSFP
jgi:hypothetical protein